jgi:hypothetical protein
VTVARQELVENGVVRVGCRRHTWYAMPHQYIGLVVNHPCYRGENSLRTARTAASRRLNHNHTRPNNSRSPNQNSFELKLTGVPFSIVPSRTSTISIALPGADHQSHPECHGPFPRRPTVLPAAPPVPEPACRPNTPLLSDSTLDNRTIFGGFIHKFITSSGTLSVDLPAVVYDSLTECLLPFPTRATVAVRRSAPEPASRPKLPASFGLDTRRPTGFRQHHA